MYKHSYSSFLILFLSFTTNAFGCDYCCDEKRLAYIDNVVSKAISHNELPGAVVYVGLQGKTVYRKAFGNKALYPAQEAMTEDTIFDMASLTKVMATAPAILLLVQQGLIRLSATVATYIPEFSQQEKNTITVEQLLMHTAGFPPDNPIADYVGTYDEMLHKIYALKPVYQPGTHYLYSDVGPIVLGELVRRITGQRLDVFAKENIFARAGMTETMFLPSNALKSRIAPTQQRNGLWMKGEVHDPRAYALGGVAGHAGLFSTIDDVATFCWMILQEGFCNGNQILSWAAVNKMLTPNDLPNNNRRGFGFDCHTIHSSYQGDLFTWPVVGHTGFTGTSLLIDPALQLVVIILSNRVHPDGKGAVIDLRGKIANIAISSIVMPH